MNETGGIDAAQMDDARWTTLAEAAGRLEAAGLAMADAQVLRAAREGNWATDEYEVSMDQVQAALAADPEGFRQFGAAFAAHAGALRDAAMARDVALAGDLVAQMDSECAACHAQYWYAE